MTAHVYHLDVHEYGLQDGCPRCAEHAERPLVGLDSLMIANLRRRIAAGLPGRSVNEARAMACLVEANAVSGLWGGDAA